MALLTMASRAYDGWQRQTPKTPLAAATLIPYLDAVQYVQEHYRGGFFRVRRTSMIRLFAAGKA
jgi:hypothetical protein